MNSWENGIIKSNPIVRINLLTVPNHISILPNGDAYACRRFESKVGNVFEEKLKNIFLKNEEKYRDFNKFVKCGKCELLGFCRGCPAVSYGDTGDFYGEDPQCWKSL